MAYLAQFTHYSPSIQLELIPYTLMCGHGRVVPNCLICARRGDGTRARGAATHSTCRSKSERD